MAGDGDATRAVEDGTKNGSGMCKAWFAGDDAPRAVEDGIMDCSGMCKDWLAGDDALRAVEDGSGMCNTGFADERCAVRLSAGPRAEHAHERRRAQGAGHHRHASDDQVVLFMLSIAKCRALEVFNTRPQRAP